MTIGHYSLGPDNYVADWRDHLFVHEYGHYIQTQIMGITYFKHVAIPSLLSAAFIKDWSGIKHRFRWFEVDASYLGAQYFNSKYGEGAEGYEKDNPNFFDIKSFSNGTKSIYLNPRTGKENNPNWLESYPHPISGAINTVWDYVIF